MLLCSVLWLMPLFRLMVGPPHPVGAVAGLVGLVGLVGLSVPQFLRMANQRPARRAPLRTHSRSHR